MAGTGSLPSGDAAVFGFLEMLALAFAFEGTAAFLRGDPYSHVGAAYAVALVLFIAGVKWPSIKTKIGTPLADSIGRLASDFRWWLLVLFVVFVYVGFPVARGSAVRQHTVEPLHGTADIPAGRTQATIPVSASLPYTLHGLTPDWATNVYLVAKHSGTFSVIFSFPAPEGGGTLDWEVIPRAGSHVAASETAPSPSPSLETPTATPTPKPWQSFVQNGQAGQVFTHQLTQNPIPGPHTAEIVATEASHQFAYLLVSWLRGSGWVLIEHGLPGTYIGHPLEYAFDDGITIRARADSVDAESLRLFFLQTGINVQRVILPNNDKRTYPVIEIGNTPADQR